MRKLTTAFAAAMAALLFAACAKKEEAPAPEAPAAAPAEQAAPAEAAPADAAPTDGSADAEHSGGDKVTEPEPPPAGS